MPAMLDTSANGVYIIAATPFTDDGAVDTASLDRLIDFYIGCGITGITVLGIMGEAPKLTHAESVALTRQVVRRANGLPVVVGASSPGFASMGALAKDVMDAGAGGVMIAPPSTLKTDDQIVTYFANAVEAIGARRAVRAAGLSVCVRRVHGAVGDPAHRRGQSVVPDGEARGMARAGEADRAEDS